MGHPNERVFPGPALQVGSLVLVSVTVAPVIVGDI
jgi:hypothetical protein